MAGIYIHIPFCKQACSYCDFHFSVNQSYISKIVKAISKEIILRKNETLEPIETIYLGGGTPSLLSIDYLNEILKTIRKSYHLNLKEVTLEMNPDDAEKDYLKDLLEIGINRLSVGVQSFNPSELSDMNRAHSSFEAEKAIENIKEVGFKNMTLDLIYGNPNISNELFEKSLEKFIEFEPQHISAYALTVEPKTLLQKQIQNKDFPEIKDFQQENLYKIVKKTLEKNGFEHYELSSFAKKGFKSVHNQNYWNNTDYVGFGPSAHSKVGNIRSWNIRNNQKYINSLSENIRPFEEEILTPENIFNELIILGLRTKKGIDIEALENLGESFKNNFFKKIKTFNKDFILGEKHIQLKPKYWFTSDYYASKLMV